MSQNAMRELVMKHILVIQHNSKALKELWAASGSTLTYGEWIQEMVNVYPGTDIPLPKAS